MLFHDVQRQQRFDRSRRAGIHRHDALRRRALKEKRHVDRDQQLAPLGFRVAGNRPIAECGVERGEISSAPDVEQQRASVAAQTDPPSGDLDQMRMLVRRSSTAHISQCSPAGSCPRFGFINCRKAAKPPRGRNVSAGVIGIRLCYEKTLFAIRRRGKTPRLGRAAHVAGPLVSGKW